MFLQADFYNNAFDVGVREIPEETHPWTVDWMRSGYKGPGRNYFVTEDWLRMRYRLAQTNGVWKVAFIDRLNGPTPY
jgi:hypothetical protein